MKSFLTLKSVDEVLSLVRTFDRLPEDTVLLDECAGRYLARDWAAPEDLPGFARSTVDGYAVGFEGVIFGNAVKNGKYALRHLANAFAFGKTNGKIFFFENLPTTGNFRPAFLGFSNA